MGNSWQSQDQKDFFDEHFVSYVRNSDEGKLKEFWPGIIEEWFKRWPLSEPPPETVAKEETIEKARKVWKGKKIEVSVT